MSRMHFAFILCLLCLASALGASGAQASLWSDSGKDRQRREREEKKDELDYHGRMAFSLGTEIGFPGLVDSSGPLAHLHGVFLMGIQLGWDFNPYVQLELGYRMNVLSVDEALGVDSVALSHAFSAAVKVRLLRPWSRQRIVPYLQAGLGAFSHGGSQTVVSGGEEVEETVTLASGGGYHLGAGLFYYINRTFRVDLRLLFHHSFSNGFHCGASSHPDCAPSATDGLHQSFGLSVSLGFSTYFPLGRRRGAWGAPESR